MSSSHPVLFLGVAFLLGACGSAAPDLSKLPVVEVPIEAPPEKDPALEKKPPPKKKSVDLPDPEATESRHQLEYLFSINKGEISLQSQRKLLLKNSAPTPRKMGRFALELWVGGHLLERVRFDFPLLGAGGEEKDALESGLTAQAVVQIPELERATRARLWDRKNKKEILLPWPPEDTHFPASVQAPAPEAEPDPPSPAEDSDLQ